MPEIVLADLLAWQPTIRAIPGVGTEPLAVWLQRELSWAVAARAGSPLLPALRGAEIVAVAGRTLAELPLPPARVAADIEQSGASALLVLAEEAFDPGIDRPWLRLAGAERATEVASEINRLLTEQRGALYRLGTAFERSLAAAGDERAAPETLVGLGEATLRRRLVLLDPSGRPIVGHALPDASGAAVRLPVGGEWALQIEAVAPRERAAAALVGRRLAEALAGALRHRQRQRAPGASRAALLHDAIFGQPGVGLSPDSLGLVPTAACRVVMAVDVEGVRATRRLFSVPVAVLEAGNIDGAVAAVVQGREATLPLRSLPAAAPEHNGWVALSAPLAPSELQEAGRQVRFVAGLLRRGLVWAPVLAFDDAGEMALFRLVDRLVGTAAVDRFVTETLGALQAEDRRGELRRTLLAFLEAGGSGVEAARRLRIHRNTLAYRLRRIKAATGQDPLDSRHWLAFHLALAIERVREPEESPRQ